METFIDKMTRSWWLIAAVFIWVGAVWFPTVARLASWIDRMRGECTLCDRLRADHIDMTQSYLDSFSGGGF